MSMVFFVVAGVLGADPLTPAEVQSIKKAVSPREAEEAWLRIGWRTNLWEARQEAAKLGKPILLWEMDGHPLACV